MSTEITTRTFPDVINEFTQELLQSTHEVAMANPSTISVVTRIGLLGQRLIYEANAIGMKDAVKMWKEANNG